jgi:hypothetical protein
MKEKWPGDPGFSFWPDGFNLEDSAQFQQFRSLYSSEENEDERDPKNLPPVFIIKKPFSSNGRGIGFVTSLRDVDDLQSESSFVFPLEKTKALAQRYLPDVLLLDGHKFTVRLYVVLTSLDPIRVYVSRL